jgi:hypothetical protein
LLVTIDVSSWNWVSNVTTGVVSLLISVWPMVNDAVQRSPVDAFGISTA